MNNKHHTQSEYVVFRDPGHPAQNIDRTFSTLNELGSIIDSLSIGIVVFDENLQIVIANSQACRMMDPFGLVHKAVWEATRKTDIKQWQRMLESVCRTGQKIFFNEVEIVRSNRTFLVDIECTPIQDVKTNQVNGGVMILRDVTEKAQIQTKLAQSERFAAIGKLAGKVAHELNNPLDGIIRYINLALRTLDNTEDAKAIEYLQHSRQGLMRMADIIAEMLEFSRNSCLKSHTAPIIKVIEEAVKAIGPTNENIKINIHKKCPVAAAGSVNANMYQVYSNLIKNALDAMAGSGTLDIIIDSQQNMSIVSFTDTGPGFDGKLAEDIFKPFFTTKNHVKGTGLGLAICKDIIEKHSGKITAENIDSGSRFTVYMPL